MSDPLHMIAQFHVEKLAVPTPTDVKLPAWMMTAEASSLGYAPGVRPQRFRVRGQRATVWFIFERDVFRDGELVGWLYKASSGTKIPTYATIHND